MARIELAHAALFDAATLILERLAYHGSIDPIREGGPIQDLRDALLLEQVECIYCLEDRGSGQPCPLVKCKYEVTS